MSKRDLERLSELLGATATERERFEALIAPDADGIVPPTEPGAFCVGACEECGFPVGLLGHDDGCERAPEAR